MDPFTALAAVNTAIKLVKTTVKTCQNLESLGPCLGQFFGAKAEAVKVIKQGGFKGSAMGQALELELAIESARAFEEEVKMLFFASNKMDIWQKIVARSIQISGDQIKSERRDRLLAKQRKAEIYEVLAIIVLLVITLGMLSPIAYFIWDACTPNCLS
tara:strand:- start:1037 stop:1510 length:474 start_codon:yes stop_codon:yes gene_type:complete